MAKWVADIKGEMCHGHEISVLRDDNAHGKRSYGWYGPDKLYISAGVHTGFDGIMNQMIWDSLVKLAHDVADDLNRAADQP